MIQPLNIVVPLLSRLRLQHACRMSVQRRDMSGREQFVRERENINMVTLGASQHGKTVLASRLTLALSPGGVPVKTVAEIDHSASEREQGRSESATHLELWRTGTSLRFSLADLPGNTAYVKNSLNHLTHADVALLVVSPDQGVEKETKLFAFLAHHLGVKPIIPVISMRETTDMETVDLVNMELQELEHILSPSYQLDNPLVSEENILKLLSHVENIIVTENKILPKRDTKSPFYMAIEQVGTIPSRGTFCAGRVLQGKLSLGSSGDLEIFYQGKSSKVNVRDLEIFRKGAESLQAGDRAGCFLKVKQDIELKRGAVLYDSKLRPAASDQFEVSLRTALPGQGSGPIKGDSVLYHSTATDGKVTTIDTKVEINEERETITRIKLKHKILAKPGDKFVMRNNQNYLLGTIIK